MIRIWVLFIFPNGNSTIAKQLIRSQFDACSLSKWNKCFAQHLKISAAYKNMADSVALLWNRPLSHAEPMNFIHK